MLEEEDVQELGLTIPLKAVYDEFLCPICFSPIQNCYMTPCGHHFCEGCIMECVNRKHVCPCCNANATKAQLVRNHWFDKMLAIVQQEKEEAAKKYFSKLVASSTTTPTGAGGGSDVLRSSRERPPAAGDLSPVEEVFQRHMQKGLAAYELYYQELRAKFEKAHEAARAKFAAKCLEAEREIEATHGKGTDKAKAEWERALRALTDESDAQTRTLRQSLSDCVANLVQACDGFLKERAAVEPRLAGLLINIVVPSRGIRWERIQLRSTDAPNELFVLLEERLKAMGTPLVDVSPDAYFVLRTPLGEEVALRDRNKPLLQYDAPPGCDVELRGQVRMQGDTHECFTLRFQKGANQVENYFVCKDCKITWVCEACAKECHKGHTVVNYMPNHKPTWACCYCPKNRKCQLPNAKSTKRG